MNEKIKIFVSYSHQNEDWVSKEGKFKLIPWLERPLEGQAEIWTDHALKRLLGEEYTKLITKKILEADIVLLLISQDFVSSQYIMDVELPLIRQQYKDEKIKVIPLLITDLTKKGKEKIKWIFDLQTYPNDTKPLIDFAGNDAEWAKIKVDILDGVENKIEEITSINTKEKIIEELEENNVLIQNELEDNFNNDNEKQFEKEIFHGNKVIIQQQQDINQNSHNLDIIDGNKSGKFKIGIIIGIILMIFTVIGFIFFIIPPIRNLNINEKDSQRLDSASIYFNWGCSFDDKGDYDKAIEAYHKATSIKPNYADAYINMGNSYMFKREYDKAIASYQIYISFQPNDASVYYRLGDAFSLKGDYEHAIITYDKAISIKPDFVDGLNNLGSAYFNKGEYDKSIAAYQKAISIKPDYADAYNNIGSAYFYKGQYYKSIAAYRRAISIKPDFADAYANMGNAYARKEDYKIKIECYKKAAQLGHKKSQEWLKKNNETW